MAIPRSVYFISDGTGITAETLGHALLAQFDTVDVREVTLPFIDTPEKARAVLETIDRTAQQDGQRPIVCSTLVNPKVLEVFASSNALLLDLLGAFIRPLELEFQSLSNHATGRSHGVMDWSSYTVRIEAVDFAVQHDDGASPRHYGNADVILIGVSRSGKTPTSLYLAMQFGIRTANYPITSDDLNGGGLPALLRPYRERLFGLTLDPERLQQIRSERRPNSRYSSLAQCRDEVRTVEEMYRKESIPYLSSDRVSIEEIASRFLQMTGLARRLF